MFQNQMQSDKRKKAKQKRQRDDTKDGESPNKSEYSRGRKKKQPPSSIHDVVTPLYQLSNTLAHQKPISFVYFRFNNVCQLGCRMESRLN